MDVVSVALILVGAFYAFAGLITARVGAVSLVLDRAISAIELRPPPAAETARGTWLIANSLVVLAGGLALMLRLDLALWVFAVGLASQLLYLFVLAPLWLDRAETPDAGGRRATINAAILYGAATGFVAWAFATDHLLPWRMEPAWVLTAAAGSVAGYTLYLVWLLCWRR